MQWLIDIVLENLKGMILMWSGSIFAIPDGWHLCDGTVGTPDLRNRFVPGAGDEYDPGDNSVGPTHIHTFVGDGHRHDMPGGSWLQGGTGFDVVTSEDSADGATDPEVALPPYYALCYIMKL